jgi:hypothetical protein
MINQQCFKLIKIQKNTWGVVPFQCEVDFRRIFLLFDWDEIFVIDFDQEYARTIILNKPFNGKYPYD